MKIYYISDSLFPSDRANSVNIIKMCEAFCQVGHEVTLFFPSHIDIDVEQIFEHYDVKTRFNAIPIKTNNHIGWLYIYAIKIFFYCVKRKKIPDLFFSRFPFSLFLVRFFRKSMILEIHGRIWKTNFINYYSLRNLVINKNIVKLVFISDEMKTIFLEKYKNKIARHILCEFFFSSAEAQNTSEKLSLNGNHFFNVGYTGSFYRGKGLEIIISLAEIFPNIGFHLAGGPERELIKAEQKNNIYYYGYLKHKQTGIFRNSCEILIAPYQREVHIASGMQIASFMSPLKIFEYMASQKPILASDISSIRNVLNESNSFLSPPDDILKWKENLQKIVENYDEAIEKANNAYKIFVK